MSRLNFTVFLLLFITCFTDAVSQNLDSHSLKKGIETILGTKSVSERYGVYTAIDSCKNKLYILDSLNYLEGETIENQNCIEIVKDKDVFFKNIEGYFQINSFKSSSNNKHKLSIEFVTPLYQPVGEPKLYYELLYRYQTDSEIEIIEFHQIHIQYKIQLKEKKIVIDMLN